MTSAPVTDNSYTLPKSSSSDVHGYRIYCFLIVGCFKHPPSNFKIPDFVLLPLQEQDLHLGSSIIQL